jgi:hypothetical protein
VIWDDLALLIQYSTRLLNNAFALQLLLAFIYGARARKSCTDDTHLLMAPAVLSTPTQASFHLQSALPHAHAPQLMASAAAIPAAAPFMHVPPCGAYGRWVVPALELPRHVKCSRY